MSLRTTKNTFSSLNWHANGAFALFEVRELRANENGQLKFKERKKSVDSLGKALGAMLRRAFALTRRLADFKFLFSFRLPSFRFALLYLLFSLLFTYFCLVLVMPLA